jgi:hypothetical protein
MKIVIVGGGTAGWIAAYFISKSQPNCHKITVVESSKIGIIGAGEGSTGTLVELLNGHYFDFKIDLNQFINEVDGTGKMGILHESWARNRDAYFAPLDTSPTWFDYDDKIFKYALSKYKKDKMYLASKIGLEYEFKLYNTFHALHFDGHKVGKFFKQQCLNDDVTIVDNEIISCNIDNNGNLSSVILQDNQHITGDFFIDCTGFSRFLMKAMNVKWQSYKKHLITDTAIPFIIPYEENEKPNLYTKSTALSSGWMWEIPLQTRKGCGYVFSSQFINPDDAVIEIEKKLCKKIDPIKVINFDPGKNEFFWKNNVLSLGLSSLFFEPLEATSIHLTIVQLLYFVKESLFQSIESTINYENIKSYNEKMHRLCDLTMDFISFHYQGEKVDSVFWKHILNDKIISDYAHIYKVKSKKRIPGFLEINGMLGSPAVPLWNWISAGIDIITPEQANEELCETNSFGLSQELFKQHYYNKKYISYY